MGGKVLFEGDVIEIDGVKYRHHPNGGGLVAETAYAAPTAHIGFEVTPFRTTSKSKNALCFDPRWCYKANTKCETWQGQYGLRLEIEEMSMAGDRRGAAGLGSAGRSARGPNKDRL